MGFFGISKFNIKKRKYLTTPTALTDVEIRLVIFQMISS